MERRVTRPTRPRSGQSGGGKNAAGVFISYRRADSAAIAGRIHDRLAAHYGASSVFLDIEDIPPGSDFRTHIRQTVTGCRVALALIGPHWLGVDATGRRRIDSIDDPVRAEIEAAMREKITLVPLLVDGAQMPVPDALPESLRDFAYLNAVRVENSVDFHAQIDRLIQFIDGNSSATAQGADRPRPQTRAPRRHTAPMTRADLDDRPAIAVLPFEDVSDATGHEHFADGLTDDIINELASWRMFPVIARTSTFAFKGQHGHAGPVGKSWAPATSCTAPTIARAIACAWRRR